MYQNNEKRVDEEVDGELGRYWIDFFQHFLDNISIMSAKFNICSDSTLFLYYCLHTLTLFKLNEQSKKLTHK